MIKFAKLVVIAVLACIPLASTATSSPSSSSSSPDPIRPETRKFVKLFHANLMTHQLMLAAQAHWDAIAYCSGQAILRQTKDRYVQAIVDANRKTDKRNVHISGMELIPREPIPWLPPVQQQLALPKPALKNLTSNESFSALIPDLPSPIAQSASVEVPPSSDQVLAGLKSPPPSNNKTGFEFPSYPLSSPKDGEESDEHDEDSDEKMTAAK